MKIPKDILSNNERVPTFEKISPRISLKNQKDCEIIIQDARVVTKARNLPANCSYAFIVVGQIKSNQILTGKRLVKICKVCVLTLFSPHVDLSSLELAKNVQKSQQ